MNNSKPLTLLLKTKQSPNLLNGNDKQTGGRNQTWIQVCMLKDMYASVEYACTWFNHVYA